MNREPGRLEQKPQELLMPWQRRVGEWAARGLPMALTGKDEHGATGGPQVGEGH